MTLTTVRVVLCASAVALVASACDELPTATPSTFKTQNTLTSSRPVFHRVSEKYREQTHPYGRGRAGSASLGMRALMDVDGRVQVDLTTGEFDVPALGTIRNVQIKVHGAPQTIVTTYNNGTAAQWSGDLGVLPWHSPVGAQAIVKGIDGKRADVVSVSTEVFRRPDLQVTALQASANPPADELTIVSATVGEANGDVGARFDCELLVNNVVVDRIENAWIKNGDHVDCAFQHAFATGDYFVQVRAANVRPADWSDADNIASTWVHVRNFPLHGQLVVSEEHATGWWNSSVSIGDGEYTYRSEDDGIYNSHEQAVHYDAPVSRSMAGELTVEIRLVSGGVERSTLTFTTTGGPFWRYDDAHGSGWYVQGVQPEPWRSGYFEARRFRSGTVYWNYRSVHVVMCYPEGDCVTLEDYVWEDAGTNGAEDADEWADDVGLQIRIVDHNGATYTANPTVALPPFTVTEINIPYGCTWSIELYCYEGYRLTKTRSQSGTD